MEVGRTIAEALAHEIRAHRTLAKGVTTAALTLHVAGEDGWTVLIGTDVELLPAPAPLAGAPEVTLALSPEAALAMARGTLRPRALAAKDEIRVEGRADLLNALAPCFQGGLDWLSVRMGS